MKLKLGSLKSILGDRAEPEPQQQVSATILFADICGSTRLFEQYGDVQARLIETRVLDKLTEETEVYGGVVIKTIGDELMCRFPGAEQAVKSACDMHRAVKNDPELAKLNMAIKIGLHHGPVLVENNDVFGDAVNVAARMVSLSKADQIITTGETVGFLYDELRQITRNLGRSSVRGKQDEIEIAEVIWNDTDTCNLTQMAGASEDLRNLLTARLVLEYRGKTIELMPSAKAYKIGRWDKNDLVVDRELVSRTHAAIEFRQGKFILVDQSTNGTYLLLDNGSRFFVRREEFNLHDRGMICLGQLVKDDNPDVIRYVCSYA